MTFLEPERWDRKTSATDCQVCFSAPITNVINVDHGGIATELHVCGGCAERFEVLGWQNYEIVKPDERNPFQDEWEAIYGALPPDE